VVVVFLAGTTGLVILCLIILCFLCATFFSTFGVAAVVLDFVVAGAVTAFVVVALLAAKALPAPVMSSAEERMAINIFFDLNMLYTPFVFFVITFFILQGNCEGSINQIGEKKEKAGEVDICR
jgi:ABC-type transport system involved in multi-copper enzyme maturation permease subunit